MPENFPSTPPERLLGGSTGETLAALATGSVLALGNLYLGLKLGFSDSGNVTSVLLGAGLLRALPGRRGRSPERLQLLQSCAAMLAGAPVALGLLSGIPALTLLGAKAPLGWLAAWVIGLAAFGMFRAFQLEHALIGAEALPFPTGVVTAELIDALESSRPQAARRGVRLLAWGGLCGGVVSWLRDGWPKWIPELLRAPLRAGATYGWGMTVSPALLGLGAIIGPRLAVSILLGGGLAWAVAPPLLDLGGVLAAPDQRALASWLVWPGVGFIVGAGLAPLVQALRTSASLLRHRREVTPRGRLGGNEYAMLALGVSLVVLGWRGLHLPFAAVGAAVVLAWGVAEVVGRAAGATDIAPSGPLAQLCQALLGALTPGMAGANVLLGTAVAATSAQSAHGLWALKSGALLRVSRTAQLRAQLLGWAVGAVVCIPAYFVLVRAYGLGSARLPAPGARTAEAVALLVTRGGQGLPRGAALAFCGALVAGALLTAVGRRRWMPAAVGLGMGFLIPPSYGITLAVGAAAAVAVRRAGWIEEEEAVAVGAGLIAAEGLVGVSTAALMTGVFHG